LNTRYVTAVGAYLPLLRFERKAALAALRWSGLGGGRDGCRAVAGWDEDALTLAVEAARVACREVTPDEVVFASTSAPFFERAHATLLADALVLPERMLTLDVAGSRRCATSALLRALRGCGSVLLASGERRPTRAGSAAQLAYGDGGAALLAGDAGPARYLGGISRSHDLLDVYASRIHPTPYAAEERFVRDVAVAEVLAPTILEACRVAGVEPGAIAHAAVHEPVGGIYKAVAGRTGLVAPNHASTLATAAGDLGAAHPLFALALAFHHAKPGEIVLLAGFGSGCDALLFEVEGVVPGAADAAAALTAGLIGRDYVRFLSLCGALDLDWGVRAEFEQKAAATVLHRYGRDMIGFVGGRDARGNVQFPKTRVPVDPAATGPEALEDVRLADEVGHVVSITADRLNFTPDPPFNFGLVQFDNGARVMMEFTDLGPLGLNVGDRVRMRLRIKSIDRRRGFNTYFWKAVPVDRPALEG
jgi:3-hydroxy-3-methylglutaryl CoA synthase/uncharacterized OB-fold protein